MIRIRTALGVTASTLVTAGLLLAGGGVALADETPPATPGPTSTQGPITLTVEQSVQLCTKRIPAMLARIDRLETRIAGDADSPGSTAWLTARAEKARAAGRDALADRLDGRVENRPAVLERLTGAQDRIEAFRTEHCA